MAEQAPDGNDLPIGPPVEGELADAVEDAVAPEVKRARARFVQQIVGLDRGEGVGRGGAGWDHDSYRRLGLEPDDSAD